MKEKDINQVPILCMIMFEDFCGQDMSTCSRAMKN